MKSFKKYMRVFYIGILVVTLIGCSKREENYLTNNKISFSYKIENKEEGKLKLEISLAPNSPLTKYKVLENEEEISAGEIAEGDTRVIEIETTQSKGNTYIYTLVANDNFANQVKKDLEINIFENNIDEEDPEEDVAIEDVDKEEAWDGKSKEYKVGEKVEFDNKVYECIQEHISQLDWTPIAAPALWKEI